MSRRNKESEGWLVVAEWLDRGRWVSIAGSVAALDGYPQKTLRRMWQRNAEHWCDSRDLFPLGRRSTRTGINLRVLAALMMAEECR